MQRRGWRRRSGPRTTGSCPNVAREYFDGSLAESQALFFLGGRAVWPLLQVVQGLQIVLQALHFLCYVVGQSPVIGNL